MTAFSEHYTLTQAFLRDAYRAAEAQCFGEAIRLAWSAEDEARQMALSLEAARVEADRGNHINQGG